MSLESFAQKIFLPDKNRRQIAVQGQSLQIYWSCVMLFYYSLCYFFLFIGRACYDHFWPLRQKKKIKGKGVTRFIAMFLPSNKYVRSVLFVFLNFFHHFHSFLCIFIHFWHFCLQKKSTIKSKSRGLYFIIIVRTSNFTFRFEKKIKCLAWNKMILLEKKIKCFCLKKEPDEVLFGLGSEFKKKKNNQETC